MKASLRAASSNHAARSGAYTYLTRKIRIQYELHEINGAGDAVYGLLESVDLSALERSVIDFTNNLYANPTDAIFTPKPSDADIRKQTIIQEGHRRASVDDEIIEIVRAVWKRGWETVGSCRERPEGWSHAGMAYIWFPVAAHGQAFATLLQAAGIELSLKPKQMGIVTPQGVPVQFPGLNVNFWPRDIDRIVEMLANDAPAA